MEGFWTFATQNEVADCCLARLEKAPIVAIYRRVSIFHFAFARVAVKAA